MSKGYSIDKSIHFEEKLHGPEWTIQWVLKHFTTRPGEFCHGWQKCETYDNQGWKETEPLLNARYGHATVTLDDYELNFKDFFE